ncbi:MAG: LytR C-terminal domain-containing protein [Candidatus Levybacteria bacterium]|nr:LytR C-terminal domain-containing protein [Candidatus Levybacteria bacterium]
MTKKKKVKYSNTKIAIVFFVLLAVIIGISLLFKLVLIVRQGQFDASKRFTLSVSNNKNLEVISLSPSTKSIVVFKLNKNIALFKAAQFLEIPIDGRIIANSLDLNQKISLLFLRAILNYKDMQTNLTIIDLLKLLFFARSVPESDVNIKNIPQDLSGENIDKIVRRMISDEFIEKDNQTIQIINGTKVQGLGNRLARLVTNMGGDVIIVATSNSPKNKSSISYIDKKSYTIERLSKVLGMEAIKSAEFAIADITIIIGEDKANPSIF